MHGSTVEHEIDSSNRGVPECEVTGGVGAKTIQIKSCIRVIVRAIVENENQSAQRSITCPAIVDLDKLSRVCAGLIGINFVDNNIWRSNGIYSQHNWWRLDSSPGRANFCRTRGVAAGQTVLVNGGNARIT